MSNRSAKTPNVLTSPAAPVITLEALDIASEIGEIEHRLGVIVDLAALDVGRRTDDGDETALVEAIEEIAFRARKTLQVTFDRMRRLAPATGGAR